MDMDGDGFFGPSDWDTDGDGMPDGFEYYNGTGGVECCLRAEPSQRL